MGYPFFMLKKDLDKIITFYRAEGVPPNIIMANFPHYVNSWFKEALGKENIKAGTSYYFPNSVRSRRQLALNLGIF